MLAISSLRSTTLSAKNENQEQMESFSTLGNEELSDFSDKNLLESIDFDDLFGGISDGDGLPDLEMEILAELSVTRRGDESEMNTSVSNEKVEDNPRKEEEDKLSSGSGLDLSLSSRGEEIVSKRDDSSSMALNPIHKEGDKGRKSSSTQTKNNQGKRKVKVDWTPELHRRFVQAVEQLGVDKAVPSRILELMGIDCLTRHNIASHLQKYRSHRKHLQAREAEAASWSQRRQMYGVPAAMGGSSKRDMNPWHVPTIGFPPVAPLQHPACRPLHVWGHPSMDQSHIHIWPKHLSHSPPPPPPHTWAPPPREPSFWHQHHRVPNGLILPGPHCFPQSLPSTRFATPPVPGIPSQGMYKVDPSAPGIGIPTPGQPESGHHHQPNFDCHPGQPESGHHHQPNFDCHPSKESIDAAIGDVLSKPWLPLPLGLKPPSRDSVLMELHRQGVSNLPSTTCS